MNILFRKMGGIVDKQTQLFQSNVEQAFQIIASLPFVRGNIHEITTTSTAPFDIQTGLDGSPQGWICVDKDVNTTFYRTKGPLDPLGTLTLVPSAFGTYKFWVF